jgi:GTP cyclohydrolase I
MIELADVQKSNPRFEYEIQQVGITNVKKPIQILTKDNKMVRTVADMQFFVNLPKDVKGTHMSRFAVISNIFDDTVISSKVMYDICKTMAEETFESEDGYIVASFPYFFTQQSPTSDYSGTMHADVTFKIASHKKLASPGFTIIVKTIGTSVCPCSKEISEYGAHNQRSNMTVEISGEIDRWIWIEDIIDICQNEASCKVYPILKRIDEKNVTEKGYENPKFVEDICRDITHSLIQFLDFENSPDINKIKVTVENEESIHMHNAYATLTIT